MSGTSLQMIADEIGVTKAAVYHQFQHEGARSCLAVAEVEMARLDAPSTEAEAAGRGGGARGPAVAGHLAWPSSDAGG